MRNFVSTLITLKNRADSFLAIVHIYDDHEVSRPFENFNQTSYHERSLLTISLECLMTRPLTSTLRMQLICIT